MTLRIIRSTDFSYLPDDAAVSVSKDKVAVAAEGKGGVLADRIIPVGVPDPSHEALVIGEAGTYGEHKSIRSGVVEAEAEGVGVEGVDVVADDAVASVVLDNAVAKFPGVDELEGLVGRNLRFYSEEEE